MPDSVYIVGPNGVVGSVPATSEQEALGMGYRRATPEELSDAQTKVNADTPAGILTTFLTNAGNQFLLGAPGASVDVAAAYGNEAAQHTKHIGDTYAEENPIAAGLGSAAGFVGSLFYGGGELKLLGEGALRGVEGLTGRALSGAGASVAERAAGRAVVGATEGAAYSAAAAAAPAITEAVVGDPKAAVERFAADAGLGALMGGVLTPATGAIGDTVKAVAGRASGRLSDAAYRLAAETAGLTPTQLEKLEQFHGFTIKDIGKYLLDNGIVEMGDTGQASLTKLGERMEDVGEGIKNALQQADAAGSRPDMEKVLSDALGRIESGASKGTFTDAEKERMINTVMEHADSADFPKSATTESLGEYKTKLQQKLDTAFEKKSLPPEKQALMHLRGAIADELEQSVGRSGQPQLDNYLQLKREYELGLPLKKGFTKQAARELSPSGSLLEKIKGAPTAVVGALLGAGAGALSGGAMLALPAALLGSVVSGYVRRRSTSTLATILERASAFQMPMPKLGRLALPAVGAGSASMRITAPHFPVFAKALSNFTAQPELAASRLPNSNNTGVQGAMTDTLLRAHQFLLSKMPVNPNSNPLVKDDMWRPSDSELAKFNRYYQAVYDPKSALMSLSPEGIEALKAVYPTLYDELVQSLAQHFAERKEAPSYHERLHLSQLFDMPETKGLPLFQQTFQTQPLSSGGEPKMSKSGAAHLKMDQSLQTPTRRIEAR